MSPPVLCLRASTPSSSVPAVCPRSTRPSPRLAVGCDPSSAFLSWRWPSSRPHCPQTPTPNSKEKRHEYLQEIQGDPVLPLALAGDRLVPPPAAGASRGE